MVAGLIIKNKKVLLVHNTKHNGLRIEPPGGKKKAEEGWRDAVVREVSEELGVEVDPVKFFGAYNTNSPEGKFSVHMYFCDIISGKLSVLEPKKIPSFAWYSYDELEQLSKSKILVPNMRQALSEIRKYL